MTRTAYSEQFGRELDVEQLARLCMGTPTDSPIDLSLAATRRALEAAMPELECPSAESAAHAVASVRPSGEVTHALGGFKASSEYLFIRAPDFDRQCRKAVIA